MRSEGKVVIVTGGDTGLGRRIALRLGLGGASGVVSGQRGSPITGLARPVDAGAAR